jgi:hypothetical protein
MGNLVLTGATSGSTTIAPTDAVTATLTLPSSTGTLLSTANPQSGGVIQTVNYFSVPSALTSTTNTSWTSTGYAISITPKFSTSKILVTVSSNGGASNNSAYFTIYRNSTNLANGSAPSALSSLRNNATSASPIAPLNMTVLDSPATTSSITYTVYFQAATGGWTAYFAAPNSDLASIGVTIIAQEIAA